MNYYNEVMLNGMIAGASIMNLVYVIAKMFMDYDGIRDLISVSIFVLLIIAIVNTIRVRRMVN